MIGPDKGDGALDTTRRAAAAAGLLDRVDFVGSVPKRDVGQWLSRGDIFLNTADVDNAPVTMIEAMACGLAVVTTNVGGIADMVRAGRDALLVPAGDPEAMAHAVLKLLRDTTLTAMMSSEARYSAARCDWSEQLPRWEGLLASVLADAPPRAMMIGRVPDA